MKKLTTISSKKKVAKKKKQIIRKFDFKNTIHNRTKIYKLCRNKSYKIWSDFYEKQFKAFTGRLKSIPKQMER